MRNTKVALAFYYPLRREVKPGLVVQDEDYDFEGRAEELTKSLEAGCPGMQFTPVLLHEQEHLVALAERSGEFDGFVVYTLGVEYMRVIFEAPLAETGRPLVIVDDYLENYGFHNYVAMRRMGLPVVWTASSKIEDVLAKVKLVRVIQQLRDAKMMVLINEGRKTEIFGQPMEPFERALGGVLGSRLVRMTKEEFAKEYLPNASEDEAKAIAERWIREAEAVVEPLRDEIVTSAKVYLALKRAIEEKNVQAVTTDIAGYLYHDWPDDVFCAFNPDLDPSNRGEYPYKLPTFPCLSFMQLQSDGFPATGEMNLHALLNVMVMHYLTAEIAGEPRAGFSGGRLFDLSRDAVIYHLCCGPRKFFGASGPACSYTIRTEQETNKSCAASVSMPADQQVTALSVHPESNSLIVHQGISLGSVVDERRCRNKLAVRVNMENFIENNLQEDWPLGHFRTVYFGDWRAHLKDLAVLLGMDFFEEDKAYGWPPRRGASASEGDSVTMPWRANRNAADRGASGSES